jgi:hypothetical protein
MSFHILRCNAGRHLIGTSADSQQRFHAAFALLEAGDLALARLGAARALLECDRPDPWRLFRYAGAEDAAGTKLAAVISGEGDGVVRLAISACFPVDISPRTIFLMGCLTESSGRIVGRHLIDRFSFPARDPRLQHLYRVWVDCHHIGTAVCIQHPQPMFKP